MIMRLGISALLMSTGISTYTGIEETPAVPMSSPNYVITMQLPPPVYEKRTNVNLIPLKDSGLSKVSYSFLGFSGVIPDSANIDWNVVTERLWERKLKFKNVSGATISSAPGIVDSYHKARAERMSIKQHVKVLKKDLKLLKKDMRWNELCADYKMTRAQCNAFTYTSKNVDAKMLTAYSLTELMPYLDGKKNYILYDIYMKNAGRNFLDVVPALGDKYMSMGRYQFTSFAIGHDKDGPRAANKISNYSTNFNIPGSVTALRGIESDRAAFYFSSYNIMSLIRNLDNKQLQKYTRYCKHNKEGILQYIATAHHNPKWARKRAIQWINEKCSKDLESYQGERLKVYSVKTKTNYKAIRKNT